MVMVMVISGCRERALPSGCVYTSKLSTCQVSDVSAAGIPGIGVVALLAAVHVEVAEQRDLGTVVENLLVLPPHH
jgi:hypothetical protein